MNRYTVCFYDGNNDRIAYVWAKTAAYAAEKVKNQHPNSGDPSFVFNGFLTNLVDDIANEEIK